VPDTGLPPDEVIIKQEKHRLLLKSIQELDEKHRFPILLKYFSDHTETEISTVLGLPLTTVKSRLYTARQRLKISLTEIEGGNNDGKY
jgi:RNA polymerase sigma-70 factor (ECF subfamily)